MLTVSEFADLTGFGRQSILRWIRDGRLFAIKGERDYRIPRAELDLFLKDGLRNKK